MGSVLARPSTTPIYSVLLAEGGCDGHPPTRARWSKEISGVPGAVCMSVGVGFRSRNAQQSATTAELLQTPNFSLHNGLPPTS